MAADRKSSEERRRQIADAALRIIGTKGVHRLTAMELAREVGIADGTIFRHFKNKDEIVQAAIARLEELLQQDLPPEQADPLARLGAFVVQRLTKVRAHPAVFRLAFGDRLEEVAGAQGLERMRAMVERSQAFVGGCLAQAQARRLVDPALPLGPLVWTVTGTMRMAVFAQGLGPREAPSAADVWKMLERLLRATAPEPASGPAKKR